MPVKNIKFHNLRTHNKHACNHVKHVAKSEHIHQSRPEIRILINLKSFSLLPVHSYRSVLENLERQDTPKMIHYWMEGTASLY